MKERVKLIKQIDQKLRQGDPFQRIECFALLFNYSKSKKVSKEEAASYFIAGLLDPDASIRFDVVGYIGKLKAKNFCKSIHTLLVSDSDELVRVQAAETLAVIGDLNSIPWLTKALSDKDPLVRTYAITTLPVLTSAGFTRAFKQRIKIEKIALPKVALAGELFLKTRQRAYLQKLVSLGKSKDYHARMWVAHYLEEFIDNKLISTKEGLTNLEKILIREKALAVSSTIETIISKLLAIKKSL